MTAVGARRRGVRNRFRDLSGAARLGVAATLAVTDIVQSLHANIARVPAPLGPAIADRTVVSPGWWLAASVVSPGASAARLPQARDHLLVHGSCLSERHWDWQGHDHGRALAKSLWVGYGLGCLDLLGSADVCQQVQAWMTESD